MKLIKIEHSRCNEYDKTEYYMAPDDLYDDELRAAIDDAQDKYLAAYDEFTKLNDPGYVPSYDIRSMVDTNKTVGEMKRDMEELESKRSKFIEARAKADDSFDLFLNKNYILRIYQVEDTPTFNLYWGHKHGIDLRY